MSWETLEKIKNTQVRHELSDIRSAHQQRVEAFMIGANQRVPMAPVIPSDDTRILRAKLIFEEAMETINALGVQIIIAGTNSGPSIPVGGDFQTAVNFPGAGEEVQTAFHTFNIAAACDLVEVADGCCDISVVTIGTLSACGIAGEAIQLEVDNNNLLKFADGHSVRADGKLVKPPNHPNPEIREILLAQGARETDL